MIMRESGHGSIVGRIKDTIIRGGENVFPKEVEECLHLHPLVMEAQTFGVPDSFMGEEVAAWISLKGSTLTEEQLRHFCKGKVSNPPIVNICRVIQMLAYSFNRFPNTKYHATFSLWRTFQKQSLGNYKSIK